MLEIGKHMSIKALRGMFDPEKYTENDVAYIKEAMSGMAQKPSGVRSTPQ